MYKVCGFDNHHVQRVYGLGSTLDVATEQCRLEAVKYFQERPDVTVLDLLLKTGPGRWKGIKRLFSGAKS